MRRRGWAESSLNITVMFPPAHGARAAYPPLRTLRDAEGGFRVDGALAGKARGAHTSPPCGPASDTRPVCDDCHAPEWCPSRPSGSHPQHGCNHHCYTGHVVACWRCASGRPSRTRAALWRTERRGIHCPAVSLAFGLHPPRNLKRLRLADSGGFAYGNAPQPHNHCPRQMRGGVEPNMAGQA